MSIKEINDVIDKLNPTPAFYSLRADRNWNGEQQITFEAEATAFNPIEHGNFWSEHIISEGYVLETLVFGKTYEIDKVRIMNNLNEDVRHTIKNFMARHLNTPKEPFEHTEIGKWYNRYAFTGANWPKYQSVMLDIFKYMTQNGVFSATDSEELHCKNAIAMLFFIFQRDFDKEHIKKKKKRR